MQIRRFFPFIFALFLITIHATAFAQSSPTVAIELAAAQAMQGDTVTADVVIRNGQNIAGADIGVATDDCLRIIGRTQGTYLPDASSGGFVVYDETTETSSRLAVAITDRAAIANGDGVFFQVDMEVMCNDGTGALTVSFAELSAYQDPAAEQIELIAYTQDAGTLATSNTQLALGASSVAVADNSTASDSAEPNTASADQTPVTDTNETATGTQQSAESSNTVPVTTLLLAVVAIALVAALFIYRARSKKQ